MSTHQVAPQDRTAATLEFLTKTLWEEPLSTLVLNKDATDIIRSQLEGCGLQLSGENPVEVFRGEDGSFNRIRVTLDWEGAPVVIDVPRHPTRHLPT